MPKCVSVFLLWGVVGRLSPDATLRLPVHIVSGQVLARHKQRNDLYSPMEAKETTTFSNDLN